MKRVPLLALALLAVPATAHAQDQEASTEGTRYPPSSVRPKIIGGGIAVTAIAYGVGFVAAETWPEAPGASSLKIPIVGPWMAIAQNKCGDPNEKDCTGSIWIRGVLTAIGGIAQLAGLGLVAEGIAMKTEAPAAKPDAASTTAFVVRPVPIVTPTVAGVGLVGTF
jgi:hypothetical protein